MRFVKEKLKRIKPKDTLKMNTGENGSMIRWFECLCGEVYLPPEERITCDLCKRSYKVLNPVIPSVYEVTKRRSEEIT